MKINIKVSYMTITTIVKHSENNNIEYATRWILNVLNDILIVFISV